MPADRALADRLRQWHDAGVIDAATAARIAAWEARQGPAPAASRFGRFAFGFGGLLLAAGILLFVAANWDSLSPWGRYGLLAATLAVSHALAGLVQPRAPALATTLHAVGTAALGAGIFLAGQSFHLAERWPEGFLLWALGAAVALWWLRDWPHVLYVATLVPLWLVASWQHAVGYDGAATFAPPATGLFVLGLAYLAAVGPDRDGPGRRALAALGALVTLGAGFALPFADFEARLAFARGDAPVPGAWLALGWAVAALAPLAVGAWLRGRAAWPLLVALAFALVVTQLDPAATTPRVLVHVLYLGAAVALTAWGVRERHRLRVNLGVAAFALVVLSFYYSSVFDRFGRSLGLIALGALFIGGGWALERTRRRLLDRIADAGR